MQLFTKNGLYLPPAAGEADHADPNFKPRLRGCGRCSNPFETTPRWRYFCPVCRKTPDVKKGLRRTLSISGKRRPRGAE